MNNHEKHTKFSTHTRILAVEDRNYCTITLVMKFITVMWGSDFAKRVIGGILFFCGYMLMISSSHFNIEPMYCMLVGSVMLAAGALIGIALLDRETSN